MRCHLLLCSLIAALPLPASSQGAVAPRDGQHDFDFEFGTWKTHLRRLVHPLTGSTTWVRYEGTLGRQGCIFRRDYFDPRRAPPRSRR